MNKSELRKLITKSLRRQGFRIRGDRIVPPVNLDKDRIRSLHGMAVNHKIERSSESLARHEDAFIQRVASGRQVKAARISPKLIEIMPDSQEELLFRYVRLHWSIPISSGYGRRLRFLVVDDHNDKIIGIIGLGDPVFSLAARDNWVGWDKTQRGDALHHVMDAFVLGAVPPYSQLLCGKLIAMLAASNEVRDAFNRKYYGRESLIRRKKLHSRLALITTTSALGRSSLYNRLKFRDRLLFESVGFTSGSGEFQFLNGMYSIISQYVTDRCLPTAKQSAWGSGFRNRREVVKKCLQFVGLSADWIYHGIQREIFVVPMAKNTAEFLRGDHSKAMWFDQPSVALVDYFKDRWLLPRVARDKRYREFERDQYRIWNNRD